MGSELGVLGLYGLVVVLTILVQAQAGMMQVGLYAFGLPGLRTLVWGIGVGATVWIYFAGFAAPVT